MLTHLLIREFLQPSIHPSIRVSLLGTCISYPCMQLPIRTCIRPLTCVHLCTDPRFHACIQSFINIHSCTHTFVLPDPSVHSCIHHLIDIEYPSICPRIQALTNPLSIHPFSHACIHLPQHVFLYPSIPLSIHLLTSVHPSIHLSVLPICIRNSPSYLSVHLCMPPLLSSIHPVLYPYPFFHPFTHPSLSILPLPPVSAPTHLSLYFLYASSSLSCCAPPVTVCPHTFPFRPPHLCKVGCMGRIC